MFWLPERLITPFCYYTNTFIETKQQLPHSAMHFGSQYCKYDPHLPHHPR